MGSSGKVVPGYILGYASPVCATGEDGSAVNGHLERVDISLGLNGLRPVGIENLAAHEVGHALGMVHSDKKGDLMYPSFDQKEERKRAVCPSNLNVGALVAEGDSYSVSAWGLLTCS